MRTTKTAVASRGHRRARVALAAAAAAVAALTAAGCARTTAADVTAPAAKIPTAAVPKTTAPSAAPATSAPTAAAACPASGLLVGAGPTDGAMGLRQVQLTLTDCGPKSRPVSGYPELRLLDDHGRTVPVAVHHGDDIVDSVTDPGPATTTLHPGGKVVAVLAWRNTYTVSDEPPALAATVRVTVAGVEQPIPLTVDLGNTGKIDVTAWYTAK
ncbi:DUF4232 domain-containing protein [Streptomyces sp. CA2R106]|uniref:DUF4232 domain-containing protein n=1 Tax=Streptomyces sp. CA2R106 TaxID=3120153 RepID=UPI00300847A1